MCQISVDLAVALLMQLNASRLLSLKWNGRMPLCGNFVRSYEMERACARLRREYGKHISWYWAEESWSEVIWYFRSAHFPRGVVLHVLLMNRNLVSHQVDIYQLARVTISPLVIECALFARLWHLAPSSVLAVSYADFLASNFDYSLWVIT